MSPTNPTHATVAHMQLVSSPYPISVCHMTGRMTSDPRLVTCRRCLKTMQKPARI